MRRSAAPVGDGECRIGHEEPEDDDCDGKAEEGPHQTVGEVAYTEVHPRSDQGCQHERGSHHEPVPPAPSGQEALCNNTQRRSQRRHGGRRMGVTLPDAQNWHEGTGTTDGLCQERRHGLHPDEHDERPKHVAPSLENDEDEENCDPQRPEQPCRAERVDCLCESGGRVIA